MESILIISALALCFIVWKLVEVSDCIGHINARLNNQDVVLAEYYKMLKRLLPKSPVEIPVRLDDETVKEMIPYFKRNGVDQMFDRMAEEDTKKREAWMDVDDTEDITPPNEDLSKAAIKYRKAKLKDNAEKEYLGVLKSGMFWEWYPDLTGVWEEDKIKWLKIYNDLTLFRAKYKEYQEYAALEGAELDYLTDEQRVELLKEINKRKKINKRSTI